MTISSTNRKAGPYVGNDSAAEFAFAFKVFTAADLLVVRADSDGAETELTLDTDYTVTLNANQDTSPGGTITLPAALATGLTLTITSDIEPLQATDLTNQGGFYPKVITNALDRAIILIQQMMESVKRSMVMPLSSDLPSFQMTEGGTAAGRADRVIGFDADGNPTLHYASNGTQLGIDLASTAASKGASLVGYPTTGETVQAALDARLPEIGTYANLRAYTGPLTAFFVKEARDPMRVDASDTTSADDGEKIIVDAIGRRWKLDIPNRTYSKRYEATATDDAGTPDALFRASRTHAGATSPHAFRDQTTFNPSADGVAACSFDAAILTAGARPQDHIIGFQSRNTHGGSGQLSIMYGSGSFNIANGPITSMYGHYSGDNVEAGKTVGSVIGTYYRPSIYGTVANAYGHVTFPAVNAGATVTNYIGYRAESANGSGTVTNEFGFYCKALSKGSAKYPIYVEATTGGLCYIATKTQIDEQLQVGGSARMTLGGSTSAAFPGLHYNYDPRTDTYIASTTASGFLWSTNNFTFRHALAGTAGNTPTFTDFLNIRLANDANYGATFPGADNARNLGISSVRWKEIFAANGTINTSDAREKTPVRSLTAAEIAAARDLSREIGAYKFLTAVAEKGDAAREHIGMTVQRAIEIMQEHGLDPFGYGFVCYDQWEAEETIAAGDRYGFRMDELLAFIARGFEARLTALESA